MNGGQTVAVVGVSGSGKSTIISLMQRFYDPVAGQVLLDGRDLKLYNLRWLRSHPGLIQQEPIIFSTTIRENIIYARHNASEAEMKEAARIANAHHFISSLPHGYDTHVGMRGVDLTPGQKQRIAIARVPAESPSPVNGGANGLVGNPNTANAIATEMYEERLKLPLQRISLEDAAMKQRFGDQILDPNHASILKPSAATVHSQGWSNFVLVYRIHNLPVTRNSLQ
ncbi:hypothetical protein KIW84_030312 [Lathyrus oleraceus]|uniref:ABC transporter domain-containing protein n=1 Tax=Pisum sativum TaxID=3888 RepID=A0A9D4XMJ0_PEA|nr:hypothetical protein KIW84_030312 [Pisum sativum]